MGTKLSVLDRDRKAIAAIQKHYAPDAALVLHGVTFAPADIVKILQDQIDALDATSAAKAAYHQAVTAEQAVTDRADSVFDQLMTRVVSDFGTDPTGVLADFGTPSRQLRPDLETRVEATRKAKATRAARHTMGSRQKAKIKGAPAPATPPDPTAQG